MGGSKDASAVRQQANAAGRIAESQEALANTQSGLGQKYVGQGDTERALQQDVYGQLSPLAASLMASPYAGIQRPDISAQIRRDYASNLANIQNDVNRNIAASEDYYTSMGLGRSGMRGMGFGGAVAGGQAATQAARQAEQQALTGEQLARYQDILQRKGLDIGAAMQGAGILRGQQDVFNPYASAQLGESAYAGAGRELAGATGSRGTAIGGFRTASQMPSTWSRIAGIAGGVLGALGPTGPFAAGGAFGKGGGFANALPWGRSSQAAENPSGGG
jgi:hypothetical protein